MYFNEILRYLMWPGLIIITWFIIKYLLQLFGKKFPETE